MQINKSAPKIYTHQGATAGHCNAEQQLRRSVLACMLFENTFYESGYEISQRIKELVKQVDPIIISKLAVEAREKMGLRHVPLLLVRELARSALGKRYVSRTLQRIITRPDQLADFLALYWSEGKCSLSAKVKQGLAYAFQKFSEYQLAKNLHNDRAIKLRDVLFLCHAKPKDAEQDALWKRLINNQLVTPDTWETNLASGADKCLTFERLMHENKLGALAFIRNIRNMLEAGYDQYLMNTYSGTLDVTKVFPWQFIMSAKINPQAEPMLETMLYRAVNGKPKINGKTIVLVDVSGSMADKLSEKSQMSRFDAANGLAILLRELCSDVYVYSFSNNIVHIPPRHGFALRDAIMGSQPAGGTALGTAVEWINNNHNTYDRLIVITDEQANSLVPPPKTKNAYIMNVASYKNGIDYSHWKHISGFSAGVIDWIYNYEKGNY